MTDLIPRKSWTLAFEELEGVVFHLKELTDAEFLEVSDMTNPLFSQDSKPSEKDRVKFKLFDYFLIKVEGMEKEDVSFSLKLNVALQLVKYLNPDVLNIKKT